MPWLRGLEVQRTWVTCWWVQKLRPMDLHVHKIWSCICGYSALTQKFLAAKEVLFPQVNPKKVDLLPMYNKLAHGFCRYSE